jgi:hypothetical protein
LTTLKSIFAKPVDRQIDGVIKADDNASLRLELEEYVLTNEVEKRLESFLDAYCNYENANGVWLSGFFGSGKSHLLKILALILENRKIEDSSALELMLPKCSNEILRANLKRAVAIPSKSILFNIDQKADVISKTQIDALLAVFVKVFDEMCGYYGKQGHIAQFERDLDNRGLYEQFKSTYENIAKRPWQSGREQALMESKSIAQAYAKVAGSDEASAAGILEKYRSQYKVSIEDFAEKVQAYLDTQAPNFRLNFFVDEVGQYVADNVKLMTNLQTVAESLNTKCKGRAWIIVTAQEDMSLVVGEMSNQKGNDFSKIQARFKNRMKLTSVNVAEVIQKRLLAKNEEGIALLSDIYHAEVNNFKTLFDFGDGSQVLRNFKDRDHFIQSYPFIPYQFELFQIAIQALSQHNAFEGKHSSVGERSMLSVFQQVAIKISDHNIGQIGTFDLMFEGIRTTLKSDMQAIWQAEKNLDNDFAIRLMKALFLVKYVKAFKPTVRNLRVLMMDSFKQDSLALTKQVEEALNLLEQQTYIQRNGDLYEYLTDDEKNIEQEIKNTEVESSAVAAELEKLVFDHAIKTKKIRNDKNGQDHPFSRKLDDRLHGREFELAIHVISPFHENVENKEIVSMQSMGRDELLVLMPPDDRLIRDLKMFKKTEKYVNQNVTVSQQASISRILSDKANQNKERYSALEQSVQKLLGRAKLFVAGSEFETSSEDATTKIVSGFHELISKVYPNLRMLRGIAYTESGIASYLRSAQATLLGNDATKLEESEHDVLAFIQSNSKNGLRTTLKNLVEKFSCKPYGWYNAATICTLASLCARGKIEVRSDANILTDEDLENALKTTSDFGNLVLEPQVEFTASQVRNLKQFYEDFLDMPPTAGEAKSLAKETSVAIAELIAELKVLTSQAAEYPFLSSLTPLLVKLQELTDKPYAWYLTELSKQADDLIDMKERMIEPLRKFMKGSQKGIFDNARKFVQTQEPNFAYLKDNDRADTELVIAALTNADCFKGNAMQQLKVLVEALQKQVQAVVEAEIAAAKNALEQRKQRLESMEEFVLLTTGQREQIANQFKAIEISIEQQKLIAMIRDNLRRFEESDYQKLLTQVTSWAQPAPVDASVEVSGDVSATPSTKEKQEGSKAAQTGAKASSATATAKEARPDIQYISCRAISVPFNKAWLANSEDVESYLACWRKELLREISNGKRIEV